MEDISVLPTPPATSRLPEPATNLLLPASAVTVACPTEPSGQRDRTGTHELDLAHPGSECHRVGIAAAECEGVATNGVGAALRQVLLQGAVIARIVDG
jgi:hypothetical protein